MRTSQDVALRTALAYAAVGTAWIALSDYAMDLLPVAVRAPLSLSKGFLFIAVTAIVLYFTVRHSSSKLVTQSREIESVERLLSQVVDTVPVGVLLVGEGSVVTFGNPAAARLLDIDRKALVGRTLDEIANVDTASDATKLGELLSRGAADGVRIEVAGAPRAVIARSAPVSEGAPAAGWVVALADVTEDFEANQRVQQLLDGYRFLTRAALASAQAVDVSDLLHELCVAATEEGGFSAAWAVTIEAGGALKEMAMVGLSDAGMAVATRLRESFSLDGDMIRRVMNDGVYASNDVARDPRNPWFAAAAAEHIGSCAMVAASGGSGRSVAITLFSERPGAFGGDEVAILQTLRGALAFAVEKMALDGKRYEAELALEASERSYRELFEGNPQPMWVYDLGELVFLAVNDAAVAKYGYTRDEFLSMRVTQIRPTADVPRFLGSLSARAEGFEDSGLWTHVDKSGRSFPVHIFSHRLEWEGRRAELVLALEVARVDV